MTSVDKCYNIEDLRLEAKRRMPKWIFEFIDRGTEDEVGINHNIAAFRRIKLRQTALVDVTKRDLGGSFFGKPAGLPVAIAPTGAAGLCWYEGEMAIAEAAQQFDIPFIMAISSTTALEAVARKVTQSPLWLQIYIWEDRQLTYDLMKRAEDAGYEALVVTVDVNLGVNREFNLRNGYGNPFRASYKTVRDIMFRPQWMTQVLFRYFATTGMPRQANIPDFAKKEHGSVLRGKNSAVTWDDIARIRERWPGKLIIKGLMRAEDAERAFEVGADGIVVSSHGGRNLDMSVASIDALPEIAKQVDGRMTVLLDSGIRRGSDLVKAYALGADGVLLGRATLYGAAAGGRAGAERALTLLRREYELVLAHIGRLGAHDLGPDVLASDEPFMGQPFPK